MPSVVLALPWRVLVEQEIFRAGRAATTLVRKVLPPVGAVANVSQLLARQMLSYSYLATFALVGSPEPLLLTPVAAAR